MPQNPKYPVALTNLELVYQGKTRDTHLARGISKHGRRLFLVYASDRLSTHNIVHKSAIPYKGEVLTALTIHWLTTVLANFPNHLVAYGQRIYDYLPGSRSNYPLDLRYRAIIVEEHAVIPYEFIFRAYLAGSLYNKFYSKGLPNPFGIDLPEGLKVMSPFDPPIFTPTEKSEDDDEVIAGAVVQQYPDAVLAQRRAYNLVRAHVRERGIELVDWKGEVGDSEILIDEIGTPDCCRFCELSDIREGVVPSWLDKQLARDEAERIWAGGERRPLAFRPEVVYSLASTYLELFERVVGMPIMTFQARHLD